MNPRPRYGAGLLLLAAAVAALLFLSGGMHLPFASGDPGSQPGDCAYDAGFYAYHVGGNKFGPPAADGGVQAKRADVDTRVCKDPALLVALESDRDQQYLTPAEYNAKVSYYLYNRDEWVAAANALMDFWDTCVASIPTMGGGYRTLAMQVGTDRNQIPTIFEVSPDRSSFEVLRFSNCAGKPTGWQMNLKLDCGFQPVRQSFPGIPSAPPPPQRPQQPHNTPTTRPHYGTSTTQPHTVCTTFPCGKPAIPPAPHQCQLSQNQCDPGDGPSTPRPADPVQPTATVAPPVSTPPPTNAPPPSQPPQTTPTSSPVTAPA